MKTNDYKNWRHRLEAAQAFPGLMLLARDQLCEMLNAFQISQGSDSIAVSEVTEQHLVCFLSYAFSHFGVDTFSPLAQGWLAVEMAKDSGLPLAFLSAWLESVACAALERNALLSGNSFLPCWESMDRAFLRTFCVRLVCTEMCEGKLVGLDIWNQEQVTYLKEVAENFFKASQDSDAESELRGAFCRVPGLEAFVEPLLQVLREAVEDPFVLLLRRMEIFLKPFGAHCSRSPSLGSSDLCLFSRIHESTHVSPLNRIAALMVLLQPHILANGLSLFRSTPVSLEQIEGVLWPSNKRAALLSENCDFNLNLIREWLGVPELQMSESKLQARKRRKQVILHLLTQANAIGLAYELTPAKTTKNLVTPVGDLPFDSEGETKKNNLETKKKYGLTKTALLILRPYRTLLTQAVTSCPPNKSQHSLALS